MIKQSLAHKSDGPTTASDIVEIPILLEAKIPLLLGGTLPLGNIVSSLAYVAGSTWRGAIAGSMLDALNLRRRDWQQSAGVLPAEFGEIFDENQGAHFGFLYPVRMEVAQAAKRQTLAIPLTARQCKQETGFAGEGHGVFDSLRNRLAQSLEEFSTPATGSEPATKRPMMICPHVGCGGRLERVRGYASRLSGDGPIDYRIEEVDRHSFVRVGLNRYTETAQDQFLYVQDALIHGKGKHKNDPEPLPLTFVGTWRGTTTQAERFRTLVGEHLVTVCENVYELRVGMARARGMGAVYLHLLPQPTALAVNAQGALATRLRNFQPQDARGKLLDAAHLYASITVRSLLQLLDNNGMMTAEVTAELLRSYCPAAPASLELWAVCTMLERQTTGGWSGAWGLPKIVMPAIGAGSVLVVRAAQHESEQLLRFLSEIEQHGLGEHLTAGWGDVLVCDPFHLIHAEGQVN